MAYSYLLGLYLGDGHLVEVGPRCVRLTITLDARYPAIVRSAQDSIGDVLPSASRRVHVRGNARLVSSYSVDWLTLLPQHGAGPKHLRNVGLRTWQRVLTTRHPRAFLCGLFHSDGCRFVAVQQSRGHTYRYPRYCFSNRSPDLIAELQHHLDLLGIEWTRSNEWTIQVARRESVFALDGFIGPKR